MNKLITSLFIYFIVSLSFPAAHAEAKWGEKLIESFEFLGSDLNQVQRKTTEYNTTSWYRTSVLDVASVGAGACAVPLSGMATLPAEFLYLMREIYNSSMGLGFLINGDAAKEDFAIILGLWSEEITLDDSMLHHVFEVAEVTGMTEEIVKTIGSGTVTQSVATKKGVSVLIAQNTGAQVAGKLAAKVAAKAGAKISSKYAAKMIVSWMPFISAVTCGGLNAWIMNGVLAASEDYYKQRARVRKARYSQ